MIGMVKGDEADVAYALGNKKQNENFGWET
jgi:hypothetical protein